MGTLPVIEYFPHKWANNSSICDINQPDYSSTGVMCEVDPLLGRRTTQGFLSLPRGECRCLNSNGVCKGQLYLMEMRDVLLIGFIDVGLKTRQWIIKKINTISVCINSANSALLQQHLSRPVVSPWLEQILFHVLFHHWKGGDVVKSLFFYPFPFSSD